MNSILNNNSILLEYFGEDVEQEKVIEIDPYESVKKMIVYSKLINLRNRLQNLNEPDTEITEIIDYINIIIQYYPGYKLSEVTNLVNGLIDVISKNWNINVSDPLPAEPIKEEPIVQPVDPEQEQQPIIQKQKLPVKPINR